MTTLEKLDEINAAISAVLNGSQEYAISGRRIRRADLSTLLQERTRLEAQLASENGADIAVAYLGKR
ncbi:MAG: peptidylprolyl isomerase [Armatimonadota bacterium]|nr:peptidylprolyl isomerase [bacterium]